MTEIKQPAENVEPVAWLDPGTEDVITQTRKTEWERFFGEGGKLKAASYTVPLYAAQPSGQAQQDSEMLDWLESQAKKSPTGISFDYAKFSEDGRVVERGWRFIRRHYLGPRAKTLRQAIEAARQGEGGEK